MPNTLSAAKRLRQNSEQHKRNRSRKNTIKKTRKEFEKALENNDLETARTSLAQCYKALDKGAKTNAIADNKAARLKSRLTRKLNAAQAQ